VNSYRLRAYFYLLVTAIIWGAAAPVIKFTLGGIPALPFLTYRFGLSALLAIIIFAFFKKPKTPRSGKTFFYLLLYGFITSTVALGLLFLGIEKTTVLDSTFITLVGPIMIVLSGVFLLKERVSRMEKIGMLVAFSGTFFTVIQPLFESRTSNQIIGNMLVIAYLFANTASAILVKKLSREKISALEMTNVSFIIGFVTIAPLAFAVNGRQPTLNSITNLPFQYHLGVWFMAFISGSLAYTLWAMGQKTIEVGEAALFSYLYPVFSAPLAVLWLGEKVTLPFVIGASLISVGVFIAEYKKRKKTV